MNSLGQDQGCNEPVEYQQSNNYYWVCYGEAPAYWTIDYQLGFDCGTKNLQYVNIGLNGTQSYWTYQLLNQQVALTSGVEGDCLTGDIRPSSTRFAILGQLPQTLTLSGRAPFVTTYGMPVLYVYNGSGTVVSTETATSVSSDSSQATFPFPSSLQQNGYSLAVANQISGGPGISTVGTNFLSIATSQAISGSPFGVAVASQTVETINCVYVPVGTPPHQAISTQCSPSSSNPSPVPVVTLYSANQALVGSTPVNVGANPTAVATYSANAIYNTVNNNNGYITTIISGSLRAVVANSGSNTVTVLDTVAATPIATIAVGNNPVALAVSSDGTVGYVANYGDSTVTEVNLSTNTPVTTVSVGGKPTSVSLTSGGILWVGGSGFLTEMNASTMTVIGTESAPNIVSLSYSNHLGQLIVESTDLTGAVYQDEADPAAFSVGGRYTALASHSISRLGSYTVGSGQTMAFTATQTRGRFFPRFPVILPGAPPLVVQDDWAVVTATPTGFTITDASGHQVLVSETTPSPITGIAVDHNLSVVYLTMPDSNTLLTVPLPGVN